MTREEKLEQAVKDLYHALYEARENPDFGWDIDRQDILGRVYQDFPELVKDDTN